MGHEKSMTFPHGYLLTQTAGIKPISSFHEEMTEFPSTPPIPSSPRDLCDSPLAEDGEGASLFCFSELFFKIS